MDNNSDLKTSTNTGKKESVSTNGDDTLKENSIKSMPITVKSDNNVQTVNCYW